MEWFRSEIQDRSRSLIRRQYRHEAITVSKEQLGKIPGSRACRKSPQHPALASIDIQLLYRRPVFAVVDVVSVTRLDPDSSWPIQLRNNRLAWLHPKSVRRSKCSPTLTIELVKPAIGGPSARFFFS